ncbi:MAG: FHA domain-containing protein, partial [Clostridia bacterium]|nr:FHA domain-containing protein [Clostridia bacterium]
MNELTEYYILLKHAEGIFLAISFLIRFLLPVFAFLVIFRAARSLFADRAEDEIWGWLEDEEGKKIPLSHFENTVGRSAGADAVLEDPLAAPYHATLIRSGRGVWTVRPWRAKNAVFLNGELVREARPVEDGDEVTFATTPMIFRSISAEEERDQALRRKKPGGVWRSWLTLLLLTEFQLL